LGRIGIWKRRIAPIPLVAIGGITLERAAGCIEAGADCVAAVSDIVLDARPEYRLKAWIASLEAT